MPTLRSRGRLPAALLLLATTLAPSPARAQSHPSAPRRCSLASADRAWLRGAVAAWDHVRRDALRLPPAPLPWLVVFDTACVWHVGAPAAAVRALANGARVERGRIRLGGRVQDVAGFAHGGVIRLPDGQAPPAAVMSFSASYGPRRRPYLVMAMPAVWRSVPRHAANPQLDLLVRSVFVHEMTHTRQASSLGVRLDSLAARLGLGDSLDDDVVQRRFGGDAGFRAAYERERDLLFAAAAERDPARARALTAQALAAMRARRERYLAGPDSVYRDVEAVFLEMEGVANWAAYRAALAAGLSPDSAVGLVRGSRRFWSQDEGLALFLTVDALVPCWQERVFSPAPASVLDLLAAAVRAPPSTCGAAPRVAARRLSGRRWGG